MCIWDTVMAELGIVIINNDSWFMGIKNRKKLGQVLQNLNVELIILAF